MPNEIFTVYQRLYSQEFKLALQREDFLLAGWTEQRTDYTGAAVQPLKTVGKVSFSARTRLGNTPWEEPQYYARWLVGQARHLPLIYDVTDEAQLGFNPQGALIKAARAAMNRLKDETILAACFANAVTGGDGTGSTPFPSSMVVDVDVGGTGTGLNYEKIVTALELLGQQEVNKSEPMVMVVSSKQMGQLMRQSEAIMTEYSVAARRDSSGRIVGLLGIDIVEINYAGFLSGGVRDVPLFVKSGMHLGIWPAATEVHIERLTEKNFATGIYHSVMLGATRTDEGKVVRIRCAEA
jgi:hypothetical protein